MWFRREGEEIHWEEIESKHKVPILNDKHRRKKVLRKAVTELDGIVRVAPGEVGWNQKNGGRSRNPKELDYRQQVFPLHRFELSKEVPYKKGV
ncbi:hypothetical protein NPIL_593851 [Nephila pilipes]|uniref:Uncharacterized protein n=1 Tax=Nephila pilipes TaxID=299642 RepID=A0A8X6NKN0_NEPPI|nr:hypothetical protein NPIL_593851 [Nephila pilipes]